MLLQVVNKDGHPFTLLGHTRSGFACAWAPDDRNIVTAYEDGYLHVYDSRNIQTVKEVRQVARIQAKNGYIRSLEFSSTGPPLLIAAEENDFVHILNTKTYEVGQTVQGHGELTGVGFTPEEQSLFIGNSDQGILHYTKKPEIDNHPPATTSLPLRFPPKVILDIPRSSNKADGDKMEQAKG